LTLTAPGVATLYSAAANWLTILFASERMKHTRAGCRIVGKQEVVQFRQLAVEPVATDFRLFLVEGPRAINDAHLPSQRI
jgi:hypothetical protein